MSTDESERPDDVCGFTLQPEDIGEEIGSLIHIDDVTDWYERRGIFSCIREPWQDHDYCIWHAEIKDKPADVLATARTDEPRHLDGAFLFVADLWDRISFADCRLWGADFTGTTLRDADLAGANLWRADLADADLRDADLSGATLRDADLASVFLRSADLPDADLRNTILAGVVLGNADLSTVQLNHRTRFTPQSLRMRLKSIFGPRLGKIGFDSDAWSRHAIDTHRLTTTCSEQGLTTQARRLTIWDRQARRNVALSSGNLLSAFGSWLNWQATGYGVSIRRVSRNMIFLFLASTLTYLLYGIQTAEEAIPIFDLVSRPFLTESVVNAVYFSVVTFTTSPPWTVSVGVSQWVAMVETFLGTLLVVLLGYVLGNREQV